MTDIFIDISPVHAPSLKRPKGRVIASNILVDKRTISVATAGLERNRPAGIIPMVGFQGWTPPGSDATDEDIAF